MIVLLTALQREYKAFRHYLTNPRVHRHPAGTLFETGALAGHPDRHVAMAVMGEGNTSAAALTERAITEFQPEAVLFVGIAGGLRDWLHIGDVVVATRVYGYHGGRSEDDGFHTRPRAWDAAHRLDQVARQVDRADTWWSAASPAPSRRPAVHFGPIAAGEVVLDSTRSELAARLRHHYNDAIAIEMESAGVATASQLHLATPMIAIRGISDDAGGNKQLTDRTGAPQLAADTVAAFAVALVAELDQTAARPTAQSDTSEPRGTDEKPLKVGDISNSASGHAHVSAQIGVVHGPVRFGSADPPPRDTDRSDSPPDGGS